MTTTINLTKLNSDDLETIARILYEYSRIGEYEDRTNEIKLINNRIAFLKGWTDENPQEFN